MKIRAYMREWYANGIKPEKVLNPETGRMHLPFKFKLHEVTVAECLKTDVPLVDGRAVAKLLEAMPDLMALYRLKWGNLDPDATKVYERVEIALADLNKED